MNDLRMLGLSTGARLGGGGARRGPQDWFRRRGHSLAVPATVTYRWGTTSSRATDSSSGRRCLGGVPGGSDAPVKSTIVLTHSSCHTPTVKLVDTQRPLAALNEGMGRS